MAPPHEPGERVLILDECRLDEVGRYLHLNPVWIAEDPDHMIHFNGEHFLRPYPDVMATKP